MGYNGAPHNKNSIGKKRDYHSNKTSRKLHAVTEEFLTKHGPLAFYRLCKDLSKINIKNAKFNLKMAIVDNVQGEYPLADSQSIYMPTSEKSTQIKNLSVEDFLAREWQYRPFILCELDYLLLQSAEKFPIHIEAYDYTQPIYKFKNNINFQKEIQNRRNSVINSNDIQFFISRGEKILFSRVTHLAFSPVNYKLIEEFKNSLPENSDDIDKIAFHPALYDRALSISSYVLLEGNPKKAHLYLRYDSSEYPHHNIFVHPDKREEVFGYDVGSPHFHFQNADDNLICLKKNLGNGRKSSWSTGRCNAIDCKRLIAYLAALDNMTKEELDEQNAAKLHYNMPFLQAKLSRKEYLLPSAQKIFGSYVQQSPEDADRIAALVEEFESQDFQNPSKGQFRNLISNLQLLQFFHDKRVQTTDLSMLEVLNNIEIHTAEGVFSAIDNCRELQVCKQKCYAMPGDYLCQDQKCGQSSEEVCNESY